MRWLAGIVGLSLVGAAQAAELPVRGVFGFDDGCKAAKDEFEGSYVGFEAKGSVGEGGQAACVFSRIEAAGKDRYRLSGLCSALGGPKTRTTRALTVKGPDEIVYDGTTYRRCSGL